MTSWKTGKQNQSKCQLCVQNKMAYTSPFVLYLNSTSNLWKRVLVFLLIFLIHFLNSSIHFFKSSPRDSFPLIFRESEGWREKETPMCPYQLVVSRMHLTSGGETKLQPFGAQSEALITERCWLGPLPL